MGTFEAHDIDGIGCDSNENEPHSIEVEGAPVVLYQHVGISGDEDDEIDLLGFVADSNDVLVGEDFEEQHQHCD